jgi:hypothetical protein
VDFGTKVVLLLAAVIGLITALIAYRTAKLKHDNEQRAPHTAVSKREPGPFDDMLSMAGAFGTVLVPIALIFIVYFVFVGGTRVLAWLDGRSPEEF